MKTCTKCHIEKDESEFGSYYDYKNRKRYVCRRRYCFDCRKQMEKIYNKNQYRQRLIKSEPLRDAKKKDRDNKRQLKINNKTKICADCKIEKNKTEFYKRKKNVDGYDSYCKECDCKRRLNYCYANFNRYRELSRKAAKKCYNANIGEYRERVKLWRASNKEKYKKSKVTSDKKYYKKQHEEISETYVKSALRQDGISKEEVEQLPILKDKKKLDIIIYRINKFLKQIKNQTHGTEK